METKRPREQVQALLKQFNLAGAGAGRAQHDAMRGILTLLLDSIKQDLIEAQPADFAKLQGQAQAYSRLLHELSRPAV